LVAQAEVSFAFHTKQYQRKLASLLTTDEREREILWEDMKKDWAAWKRVKGLRGAPWGAIAKRSHWNWLVNTEFFEEADRSGGTLTSAMLRQVERIFRFQGCEGSTEVAFQKLTNATKDNQSERFAPCTLWRRPTMWGLFTRSYSFKEVDPSMIKGDELAHAELPSSLLKAVLQEDQLGFQGFARENGDSSVATFLCAKLQQPLRAASPHAVLFRQRRGEERSLVLAR
jgi:hypothetical protein